MTDRTKRRVQDATGTDAQVAEHWRQRALDAEERLTTISEVDCPEGCGEYARGHIATINHNQQANKKAGKQ